MGQSHECEIQMTMSPPRRATKERWPTLTRHNVTPDTVGCNRLSGSGSPRYSRSMKVAFELAPAQAEKLRREAERLGVAPDELAAAALSDLLAGRDEDFQAAAERVLRKNEALYRRLA